MPGRTGRHRETFQERRERRAAIDDPEVVLNVAARYLEVRSRAVQEVRRHLAGAGYRADLVEAAIERLRDLGMLDDSAFAKAWAEARFRSHPRGRRAVELELRRKGIDAETLRDSLAELDSERAEQVATETRAGTPQDAEPQAEPDEATARVDAERAAAERLLMKRSAALMRVADPRTRRQRAYALLARNGFDPETCRVAASAFLGRLDDAGDGE